ncbi:MAG: alpha/beta hydrolase-fold protein [Pseudomonadota bacterium]
MADNPLGDPSERTLTAWLPPGYGRRRKGLPVLFDLAGFTGSGLGRIAWNNFSENVPERLDRLFHERKLPPCLVVFPDCFTALGGNQYINSTAVGAYADYLTRELVPFIDREFKTLASRDHRACYGKSSGGYGAFVHGMKYAHVWGAVASHSGDAGFELVYGHEWPSVLTELQRHRLPKAKDNKAPPVPSASSARRLASGQDDGRIRRFLDAVWDNPRPGGHEIMTLMILAMAATYDPDPKAPNGFRLPVHLDTGERLPKRWQRWMRHDPVELVDDLSHRRALKSLKLMYFDCGWRDQYHIHFGNRQLAAKLSRYRIAHRYLEFDGSHSGVDHRLDTSLPLVVRAIS